MNAQTQECALTGNVLILMAVLHAFAILDFGYLPIGEDVSASNV